MGGKSRKSLRRCLMGILTKNEEAGGAFHNGEDSGEKAGGLSSPVAPAPVGKSGMELTKLGRAEW